MGFLEWFRGPSAGGAARGRGPFEMRVEDVFRLSGRGIVATGKISVGSVQVGDAIVARSPRGERVCAVESIEKVRESFGAATAGENVALLLSGADDVKPGDLLTNAPI